MNPNGETGSILRHLERVLASPTFARSDRMSRFLRFIVEESLRSLEPNLKETVIAPHVFDRGPDYDPAVDPVVRVEARRLRAKLEEYYEGPGIADRVRIKLPKGSYVPRFEVLPVPVEKPPARSLRLAAILAVAICAVAASWTALHGMKGRFSTPSVAVLPFLDLSPGKELGYFCDGLTEQLIDVLSRVDGLQVPGRTSSYRFRDGSGDLRTMGAALRVNHILEGSVRLAGDRLRITAQLIDVDTGFHLWSQTFERRYGDIFALQDEISRAVSNALQVRMAARATRKTAQDAEALRTYLTARYYWYQNDFSRSADLFEAALRRDPGYALAYAGLARAYARMDSPGAPAKSEAAARRALEIDETLTEAVMVLAIARLRDWDWAGAEREFQRAIQLDPKSAEAHGEYAIGYLAPKGEMDQALRESARSLDFDPASPFDVIRHGVLLTYARRFREAEQELWRACRQEPEYTRRHLGKLYLAEARYPEALEQFSADPTWRAITLARAGRLSDARKIDVPETDPFAALYWAAAGDTGKAFQVLEAGRRSHSLVLTTLISPVWDPLRSDPRFTALLKQIGL